MRLSLRATISVLAAIAVACVAAITLSVALTSSLSSLRTTGKDLALALVRVANSQTVGLFEEPLRIQEAAQQWAQREDWDWPSNNDSVYNSYVDLQLALQSQAKWEMAGSVTFFLDNTRVTTSPFDGQVTAMLNHLTTPQRDHGFFNSIRGVDHRYYFSANGSRVPRGHYSTQFAWPEPIILYNTTVWDLIYAATSFGRTTTIQSLVVAEIGGQARAYVPFISPLYRKGGPRDPSNLFGITGTSMFAEEISTFLTGIRGTDNTQAFAFDGQGYLMGSSVPLDFQTITRNVAGGGVVRSGCASSEALDGLYGGSTGQSGATIICRKHIRDYGVASLRAVAGDRSFAFVNGDAVRLVEVGSDLYYVASSRVPLRYAGLELQLIASMPESDVIGNVVESRNVAIAVTCVVVVAVAAVIFLVITLLLAPLSTVAERMQKAANFEDTSEEEALSVMAEVADLQTAYYEMNAELLRIRGFVPQAVLLRNAEPSDDEGDLIGPSQDETDTHDQSQTTREDDTRSVRSSSSRQSARVTRSAAALVSSAHGPQPGSIKTAFVTVLTANLRGFSRRANTIRPEEIGQAIAATAQLVDTTIQKHHGVVAHFHGDHFTATFNAARSCAAHSHKACLAAQEMSAEAPKVGLHLPLAIGVASGRCSVGYVGSDNMKAFSTLGAPFVQSLILERICKLYDVPILATKRTVNDLAGLVGYVYIDVIAVPGRASSHANCGPKRALTLAATLTSEPADMVRARSRSVGGDEWLYIVNQDGGDARIANHNLRFEAVLDRFGSSDRRFTVAAASFLGRVPASDESNVDAAAESTSDSGIPAAASARLKELERLAVDLDRRFAPQARNPDNEQRWMEAIRAAVSLGRYYDDAIVT